MPDLDNNIKWGNSLISSDFYEKAEMSLLDEEELCRINVFDWETNFPQVFTGDNPGSSPTVVEKLSAEALHPSTYVKLRQR